MKKNLGQVSVELVLGLALAIVALIIVVQLFSSNFETLVANSGMQRLFNQKERTVENTNKQVYEMNNTQVDLQTTADQGILGRWKQEDAAFFESMNRKSDYTNAEILDIAKYMTREVIINQASTETSILQDYPNLKNAGVTIEYRPKNKRCVTSIEKANGEILEADWWYDNIIFAEAARNCTPDTIKFVISILTFQKPKTTE